MILAAGLGTRLRPLSYEAPKPIVPVLGRPLCSYNMEFLAARGVRAFLLNLHQQPKVIQQRVSGWAGRAVRVEYAIEPEILGTGGGVANAAPFLRGGGSTFLTANGDTIVRFPLREALAFHRSRRSLATLVLFPDPQGRYSPVWYGEDGRLLSVGGEGAPGARKGFFTGVSILETEILDEIPPGRPSCIVRDTHLPLAARGAPVHCFPCEGSFLEFGTPSDYLSGCMAILEEREREGTLPAAERPGVEVTPPVWLSPGARVEAGARLLPGTVVEEGAEVRGGSEVSRSVLWPGARTRPGQSLYGTILTAHRSVEALPPR
jgi:NDP-sugar pyrophosphorylase family protein